MPRAMTLAELQQRGNRVALLAAFVRSLDETEARAFIAALDQHTIVSANAVALLLECLDREAAE